MHKGVFYLLVLLFVGLVVTACEPGVYGKTSLTTARQRA